MLNRVWRVAPGCRFSLAFVYWSLGHEHHLPSPHTHAHTHTHRHTHQEDFVLKNNGSFISISVKEALWLIWWSRGSEVSDGGHTGMSWCCEGVPGQGEAGGGATGAWGAEILKPPLHQCSKAQYQRRERCLSLSYVLCWKEVRTDLLTFPTAL